MNVKVNHAANVELLRRFSAPVMQWCRSLRHTGLLCNWKGCGVLYLKTSRKHPILGVKRGPQFGLLPSGRHNPLWTTVLMSPLGSGDHVGLGLTKYGRSRLGTLFFVGQCKHHEINNGGLSSHKFLLSKFTRMPLVRLCKHHCGNFFGKPKYTDGHSLRTHYPYVGHSTFHS